MKKAVFELSAALFCGLVSVVSAIALTPPTGFLGGSLLAALACVFFRCGAKRISGFCERGLELSREHSLDNARTLQKILENAELLREDIQDLNDCMVQTGESLSQESALLRGEIQTLQSLSNGRQVGRIARAVEEQREALETIEKAIGDQTVTLAEILKRYPEVTLEDIQSIERILGEKNV